MRVLVVEDERQLCDAIARGLRREGIAVDVASNGAIALEKVKLNEYEVVVLDRNLPVVHGDVVCARLRTEENPARILMLTASGTTEDLVEGLGLGADDYLGSRSRSPSSSPESARSVDGRRLRLRSSSAVVCEWTRVAGKRPAPGNRSCSPRKSSRSWRSCSAPTATW